MTLRSIDYFPTNLYRARTDRNITHDELSEMTGLSTRVIYDYEAGKRKPSFPALISISNALHVSIDSLVTKDNE